jgi:lipooligosaccharide transport system permease protein
VTQFLPLSHAVALVRPLMSGATPNQIVLHLAVLAAYAMAGFSIALVLTRRRLLK